jgi:DNA topoisomerase-1
MDARGHIQATGRDQKGRKQYRYNEAWSSIRDEAKFTSLSDFAHHLPKLRETVSRDLSRRGTPPERVLAAVVWLLDRTMMRVGSDAYMNENDSYGAATLQNRHLLEEGSSLRFVFTGKSGKEWDIRLKDRRIVRAIRAIEELPGQQLFQYRDEDGRPHPIHSHDVNRYINEATGSTFTSKHFRTWGGTRTAALRLATVELPTSQREQRRALNAAIDEIAGLLRNTRAVCRSSYIHPAVTTAWEEGRLNEEIAEIRRRSRQPLKGLDADESTVLRWLRARQD